MSTTKAPPVVLIENASEEMTSLIVEIREHNNAGMNERLRQGERFFKLRAAVGKYQKSNKDGLSYTASVALTGVALSTAERNRTMWEFTQNYQISGALFLLLCEHGCNLQTFAHDLKESFKGTFSSFESRVTGNSAVDPTNADAVAILAKDLKKALKKKVTPPPEPDAELTRLETEVSELLVELPKAKSAEESAVIAEDLHQARVGIRNIHTTRMGALIGSIAPFLEWDDETTEKYLKAFADLPLPLQKQRYADGVNLLKSLSVGFKSLLAKPEAAA